MATSHPPDPGAPRRAIPDLRSRLKEILNVPERVGLRFLIASGLAGSHFDHPAHLPHPLIRSRLTRHRGLDV
jgi:hypothetical protein